MASSSWRHRPTPVGIELIELGDKHVFAWALDWPGWSRSGETEALTLEAMASYVPRYAEVVEQGPLTRLH